MCLGSNQDNFHLAYRFTTYENIATVFSERELKFMFAIGHRRSVCLSVCLSVVCNVGAPYSGYWNFRQYFYAMWYLGYPWPLYENFTEIVLGEPFRRGS